MNRIFTKLQEIRSREHREAGNIVAYIMMFPVIFAFFGLAVDTTVATYTQTSLQSNLDAATQSTLSRANNPGTGGNTTNRPAMSPVEARDLTVRVYDTNRKGSNEQPFVLCQTGSGVIYPPVSNCGFRMTSFTYTQTGSRLNIRAEIQERSKPIFLRYVGLEEFKYTIVSEARITYSQG